MVLKVATVKKKAVIFFYDGSQRSGNFFLSPVSAKHAGTESIGELLTGERNFIPFEQEAGSVALISRENIAMVQLQEETADTPVPGLRKVRVSLSLLTNEILEGIISFTLPEHYSRVSDFINSSDAFFRFDSDGKIFLVRTRFIKMISEVGSR